MRVRACIVALLCVLGMGSPGAAQSYDEFVWSEEFRAANDLVSAGHYQEAIEQFELIATHNPRTRLGVESLFKASGLASPTPKSIELLDRVLSEYEGTRFVLRAKLWKLDFERPEPADWLDRLNQIVVDAGGPSVDRVLTEDPALLRTELALLPEETRIGLVYAYRDAGHLLAGRPHDAVTIAIFGMQNLSQEARHIPHGFDGDLFNAVRLIHDVGVLPSNLEITPSLYPISPLPDSSVGGSLETLDFQIIQEDFSAPSPELGELEVLVDGTSLGDLATLRTTANVDLTPGTPFLTAIVAVPLPPLAAGTHQVRIAVPNSAHQPGDSRVAVLEYTFTIAGQSSTQTVPVSKDSTLRLRDPHLNEGANPRLILEKVQGKTTHALVGFELSQQNLAGLTSASLVLTIDPSDSPTGWGNGRNVLVAPISTGWLEGNGVDFGVPSSQKTSGSGAGVTWFSPIDEDISNNYANSAVNWNGAGAASGPPTALAVQIHNHQTGQVSFDVTQDVVNGSSSWLVRREDENVGSQVHFYSREGGGTSAGPRLVLHYGTSAQNSAGQTLLAQASDRPAAVLRNLAGLGLSGGPITNLLVGGLQMHSSSVGILSAGLRGLLARREMAVLF